MRLPFRHTGIRHQYRAVYYSRVGYSRKRRLRGMVHTTPKRTTHRFLTEREDDRVHPLGLTPLLRDYIEVYKKGLDVSGTIRQGLTAKYAKYANGK